MLYFLAVVAVILLAPFHFYARSTFYVDAVGDWTSAVTGGMLFIPLGFLYPLSRREREPSLFHVAAVGLAAGFVIAIVQLFEPELSVSLEDIVARGAGAVVGAFLVRSMNDRIRNSPRLSGRLSLEIPLVALVYLLIPLLTAASLSPGADPLQRMALLPLTLLGTRLISAVQEHHFARGGVFRNAGVALIGGVWAILGLFPVLLQAPALGAALVALAGLSAAHESSLPAVHGAKGRERRFEAGVLRGAAPYIVAYFLTAILLPLAHGLAPFRVQIGVSGLHGDLAARFIQLLEPVAALTVLGYVLAEARGRRELAFRVVARRILLECSLVAIAMEASRGFQLDASASGVRFILCVGASVLGAGIYHHQRERIRWILVHHRRLIEARAVVVGDAILTV